MPELYETGAEELPVKAIIITVDTGEFDAELSLKELEELAYTAGAEVVGQVVQKRPTPDTATYIGSGRLSELTA
ncbi:MAG: GTPase HflX, partial [Huintestinicola sp.]